MLNKIDIQIGDYVKLRDDLEDLKKYGEIHYNKSEMKFEDFRKVVFFDTDKTFLVDGKGDYNYTKEMITEIKRPWQFKTIYKRKKTVLTDNERKYLAAVIKPFRGKVKYIKKRKSDDHDRILIVTYNHECMLFPKITKRTMYKGMEANKGYKLKELGL